MIPHILKSLFSEFYFASVHGLLISFIFLGAAQPVWGETTAEDLAERRLLSENRSFRVPAGSVAQISGSALADAFDLDPTQILSSSMTGPAGSQATLSNLGVISPVRGSSFVMLSSGVIGAIPEPGTDFGVTGTTDDMATISLVLSVPAGSNRLAFRFNFLSAEYPDFIGTQFNDTFTATLTDATGSRVIAGASVNSSFFFSASSSLAGGSGFDIFADDPSGVDTVFGTGLPDAGLTDFQAVDVPMESTGSVTLTFSIADLGDGILDSAVILDALSVSAFDIVDANHPDFLDGARVTTDRESLAEGGESRFGVAADGTSRVLLRSTVSGPGQVEFCLSGGSAPQDGGLFLPGESGRNTCTTSAVTQTSAGFQAVALYLAPDEFNRGGDEALTERSVDVDATFSPTSGTPTTSTAEVRIVRPPVVLVHGLWSGSGAWTFALATDPRFRVQLADYQSTNASHFHSNSAVLFAEVREAVNLMRGDGFAATQADVAGHSMGGILSRIWVTSPHYKRDSNFDEGDIHKLVTLDTPHTGSPVGNLVVGLRDTFLVGAAFTSLMSALDHPVDQGALDDLSNGSPAILAMGRAEVPAHAVVGIGGNEVLSNFLDFGTLIPGTVGKVFEVLSFFTNVADLFPATQHDLIVGRLSQEGGLPSSAVTLIGGFESLHTSNTGSALYSQQVIDLFNSSATGGGFSTFPATVNLALFEVPELKTDFQIRPFKSVQTGLMITSPLSGTTVASGQIVTVTVVPPPGSGVERVLVVGPDSVEMSETAPFAVNLEIPVEAVGEFVVTAIGSNAGGDLFTAESVTLTVDPPAAFQSLSLVPSAVLLFGIGDSSRLTVLGTYTDGVIRDVSEPSVGTEYVSDDPSIVSVSPAGQLTARGFGTTTLIARNSAVQDSITVRVLPNPDQVFGDGFESGDLSVWSTSNGG